MGEKKKKNTKETQHSFKAHQRLLNREGTNNIALLQLSQLLLLQRIIISLERE
jgi:hypothetical protein